AWTRTLAVSVAAAGPSALVQESAKPRGGLIGQSCFISGRPEDNFFLNAKCSRNVDCPYARKLQPVNFECDPRRGEDRHFRPRSHAEHFVHGLREACARLG